MSMRAAGAAPSEALVVRGGPIRRLERALGLVRGDARDGPRVAAVLVAVSWLPLMAAALVGRAVSGGAPPWFSDPALHVRLLVALPLFAAAEPFLRDRIMLCLEELARSKLTAAGDLEALRRWFVSWRDSWVLESTAVLVAVILSVATFPAQRAIWDLGADPSAGGAAATVGAVWDTFVALPLFRLFLALWLLRWLLWSAALMRLARLELAIMPTHPDLNGGLAFTSLPIRALVPCLIGVSAVQAATWGREIVWQHVPLQQYALSFAFLVALALLLAFAPLLAFVPQMLRSRMHALLDYGRLGFDYTRQFHARWVEQSCEAILGTPDLQSLADLGTSYDVIRRMRLVPIDRVLVAAVVAGVSAPMLPLLLLEVPLPELLKKLLTVLVG